MQLLLAFVFFSLGMVGVAIRFYMVRKDVEAVLMAFPGSRAFSDYEAFTELSVYAARTYLITCVSSMVVWPMPHIRRGMLDPLELESLPTAVRKRALYSHWLMATFFLWMCLFAYDLTVTQWLRDTFR